MRRFLIGSLIAAAVIAASVVLPSEADADGLYLMPVVGVATLETPDKDNIIYGAEAGWTNDHLDLGLEVLSHVEHADETGLAQFKVRYAFSDWVVKPALGLGLGATFAGDPVGSAEAGVVWVANDGGASGSFSLSLMYTQLAVFDDISDVGDIGDWSNRSDGYLAAKMKLAF